MAKPIARRVPSDDCAVTHAGEVFYPHEGEWVEMLPGISVGDLAALKSLAQLEMRRAALDGDEDEGAQTIDMLLEAVATARTVVTPRLTAWSWTDIRGAPLPCPADDPDVYLGLEVEEVFYLMRVARGEAPAERKNDSRPLPITSLATEPAPSRTGSGMGRNRTKAS